MKYILPILITCSFLFAWDTAFSETRTTGNILSNSTFGTGNTTTSLVGQQMAMMVFILMVLGMDFHIKQGWMIAGVY